MFLRIEIYTNEAETKEKYKLPETKKLTTTVMLIIVEYITTYTVVQ